MTKARFGALVALSFVTALHAQTVMPVSKAGIFRSGFLWILDSDGNTQFNWPDVAFPFGGISGDIPITGDWNGDGKTKVGIYRSGGYFLLDYNGDGQFDANVDKFFNFVGAQAGDIPVVGDWNGDGRTKVGIFRSGYLWILDTNGDGVFQPGVDQTFAFGGAPGDVPVVGDWNGTHISKVGVFRSGYFWVLDTNGNGQFDQGVDDAFAFGGAAGDVPVTGDWNGDGRTKVGVFRQGFLWVLDANGNHTYDGTGPGQDLAFPFGGIGGDIPMVGNWKTAMVSPSGVSNGGPGVPQQFTAHYTDLYGPTDITYGQLLFNSNPNAPDGNGACQLEWNSAGALNLLSSSGHVDGAFGQGPLLSNGYCSIDTGNSRLTQTAGGYDVTVLVTFTAQSYSAPIWAFGDNAEGLSSPWVAQGTRAAATDPLGSVVNNGIAVTFHNKASCGGNVDCRAASCSASDPNVTAQASEQTLTSHSITVTASQYASAGSKTITCTNGGYLLSWSLQVYDATPNISSITHFYGGSPIFTQGEGLTAVRITGSNLGTSGNLIPAGPGVTYQYSTYWSPGEIDAYFNIDSTAVTQNITVAVATGDTGNSFQSRGDAQSQSQGVGQLNVQRPPTAQIMQGSTVVSGRDPTQNPTVVSVGQQIQLSGTVINLPSGVTISNQSWTVTGTTVANYVQSVQGATVTAFASPGNVDSIIFYWIDGDNSTRQNVTYTATLSNNTTVSAVAPFLVVRPSPVTLSGTTTMMTPAINASDQGQFPNGTPGLNFGYATDPGITFNMAENSGVGGQFALTQLVNFTTTFILDDGNDTQRPRASGGFVLDDGGTGSAQYSGIITTNQPGSASWRLQDIPAIGLVGTLKAVRTSQQFQTYFMYKPPGANSIWVTLQMMNWNWSGAANKSADSTWTQDDSVSSFTSNPTGANSTVLPQWTNYERNIP